MSGVNRADDYRCSFQLKPVAIFPLRRNDEGKKSDLIHQWMRWVYFYKPECTIDQVNKNLKRKGK